MKCPECGVNFTIPIVEPDKPQPVLVDSRYKEYLSYQPLLFRRAWATVLDYLLFYLMVTAYAAYFGRPVGWFTFYVHGIQHIIGILFIWFLYFPLFEGVAGYTLFKGLFDLRVQRDRKTDFPFFVSLKRHLADPIDFVFFGAVGIVVSSVRADHKRIGDLFARARVIHDG